MTELFEIENTIEEATAISEWLTYEAAARPGHGALFESKLLEAKKSIDGSIVKLREALSVLDDFYEPNKRNNQ